jgi:hypothetical protein
VIRGCSDARPRNLDSGLEYDGLRTAMHPVDIAEQKHQFPAQVCHSALAADAS